MNTSLFDSSSKGPILQEQLDHKLRTLFMQAPAAIALLTGPQHIYTFANPLYQELFGRKEHDLIGKTVQQVFPEIKNQGIYEMFHQVFVSGEPFVADKFPATFQAEGRIKIAYYNFIIQPIRNENGIVTDLMVHAYEVTGQVLAQRQVEESESRYKRLFDATPVAITEEDHTSFYEKVVSLLDQGVTDYATYFAERKEEFYEMLGKVKIVGVNKGQLDLTGSKDQEEFVANRSKFFVGMTEHTVFQLMDLIRNGGGIFREQTVIKNLSGELRHVWVSLKYPSAPPYSSIPITLHDVTDQVNAANAVRESEGRLRNIINQSPDPILILKGEELVLDVANEPLFRLWQVGHEAIGKPFLEILPEMKNQVFYELLLKVYHEGYTHYGHETPAYFERQVGVMETVYFNFVYQPFRESDGNISGVLVTATDVTRQVIDRRALQESERRFRTLAETLPQMIWVTDEKGNSEYTSHRWKEYSGIEDPYEAWEAMIHPEDKGQLTSLYRIALEEGRPFKAEGRLRSKTGEYRWHSSIAEPLKDEEGKVLKWIGALTDIHEHKMVSQRLEQLVNERTKELKRSNEDLQQFAHVASHDLKEPLRKVIMFSSRLKDELGTSVTDKSISFLDKIANSALRMYSMIDGVLLYSSADVQDQTREPIDLRKLLQSIEFDLEVVINEKHAVIRYDHLPIIEGSPVLIHQLFYNLLSNSLKFSREGVPPEISIQSTELNGHDVASIGLLPTRKYWRITIRDNGIGFDEEQAEKIFGTFKRLHSKDKYEGTGLGLSLCRKIAERHGGAIYAEGIPDQGSVFTILFPALLDH